AEYRLLPRAVKTGAAVRVPREHDAFAASLRIDRAADRLDDACSLMAEHDRHGIDELTLDHLEIGVEETGSRNAHQHIIRLQVNSFDRLDRERCVRGTKDGGAELHGAHPIDLREKSWM